MKTLPNMMAIIGLGLLTGCGTVQQAYKPAHLGDLSDDEIGQGLQVTLVPDKYRARIGEPVTFTMVIRNVGEQAVWIPGDPDLLLTWVYPDGRRDNLLRGMQVSPPQNAILLKPGQEHVEHSVVTTYYFNREGIHEFRAILTASASGKNQPNWSGRAISNGFGVMFEQN